MVEPWRLRRAAAAPKPSVGRGAQTGRDRVDGHVPHRCPKLSVGTNDLCAVTALEEMAGVIVSVVEDPRVRAVEPLHPYAEVRLGRHDDQVNMVVHQAIRKASPRTVADGSTEDSQVRPPIVIVD